MSLSWYEARAPRAPRVGWMDAHVGEWTGDALRERLARLDQAWRTLKRDIESIPASVAPQVRSTGEVAAWLRERGATLPAEPTWRDVLSALATYASAHGGDGTPEWSASVATGDTSRIAVGARLWSELSGEPYAGDPLGAEWRREFRASFQRWASFNADAVGASLVQRWFGELEPEAERYRRELERYRAEFGTRAGRAPTGALPDEIPREPSALERVTGGWLGGFGGGLGFSLGLAALAALAVFLLRRG